MSETEGPSRRGRPLGRRKDRVKEYMSEIKDSSASLPLFKNCFLLFYIPLRLNIT